MNKTQRSKQALPLFVKMLLLILAVLLIVSIKQTNRIRDQAALALNTAEESIRIAQEAQAQAEDYASLVEAYRLLLEEHSELAAEYESDNSALVDANNMLKNVLSAYKDFEARDPAPPQYFEVNLSEDLQNYIWSMCCEYGISDYYELVYAQIQYESQFDPTAISSTNDYGLMQINVCNHEWLRNTLGVEDFLDPYDNVHCGIYMLSSLLHKYDIVDALMAYNLGERGASKLWQRGIHSTTYTEQVMANYHQFIGDI